MLNLQIPFMYRLESQDKGPVHINVSQISSIKNSELNSNWSVVQTSDSFYVSYLSPEELVADILNSYNLTMKTYL